jgi:hypothetical protein
MHRLLLVFIIFISPAALAAEHDYEFQFSPNFGLSSEESFFGLYVGVLIPLNDHWQWKVNGGFTSYSFGTTAYGLSTGAVYNFQTDWMNSIFVGGGVGYNSVIPLPNVGVRTHPGYAYLEVGKRFQLNASGTFAYTPSISFSSNFQNGPDISIHPFTFTWGF